MAKSDLLKSRTIRVFISSTFRDMHAERDHLLTVVFPELRERIEGLGLEFFEVDLRWGVPEKTADGETANSWEYCRQWIERVEPFFICILGQRYGWVPAAEDFQDEDDRARQSAKPRSITDCEVRHAVLDRQRKRRSYFYLRETKVPELPAAATSEQKSLVEDFVDPADKIDRLNALKMDIRKCGRPVRGYECHWNGKGFVDLDKVEKRLGPMVLEDLWSGVLRDERYVSKDIWRQVLGANPDEDRRYTDESRPIPRALWTRIVALAKPPPLPPLEAERRQMEAFAASRLRWFQGRTSELRQLADFSLSSAADAPRLAVVAAVPGQGKSALIAKLGQVIQQRAARDGQPTFLVTHFVGATERSATAPALVERLLAELDGSGCGWPAEKPREGGAPNRDFNSQCELLRQRLGDYAGRRRIVILLDALNQLTDGHELNWLPPRLGAGVRMVVSCVEGATAEMDGSEQRVLRALAARQPAPLRVPLTPLTPADVRAVVVEYLKEYCKELDREQVEAICRLEPARNPLYLLVMLGELRTLGGNEMNRVVGERIAALARDHPDTVSLFHWVLQRLEVFGPAAVRWWCLYLAHGRVGMASHELAALLARKLGADASSSALRIERGLRRYLLRRGGQLDFFHGQLRQAVVERYGPSAAAEDVHRDLAECFGDWARGGDPLKEWETESVRGFAECVYHHARAGRHEAAAAWLTHFPFLLHKLRVGLLEGVFADFEMVRLHAQGEWGDRLQVWASFFHERAHILRRGNGEWPAHKIFLQLAAEHADDSPLTHGAERWLAQGRCDWLWWRRVPRPSHGQQSQCLATLEGHDHDVAGVLALPEGRLLSWDDSEATLRLWDGQSGACLATLTGHGGSISGAKALADGRLLSWSEDGTLRLWDERSGACLRTLAGHGQGVIDVLTLADGRLLSWSYDRSLRLWDGQRGECLEVLTGHGDRIGGALELADGRLLSWSDEPHAEGVLLLWDGRGGQPLATMKGHARGVLGALALADGRLLSWSYDRTLRLWDGRQGECLAVLRGHVDRVHGALAGADGRFWSWSNDGTLRVWSGHGDACPATLAGHGSGVGGVLQLADGRLLSWSDDGTLRVWNGQTGNCEATLTGHSDSVCGALELADGRVVSWSWDGTLRIWDAQSGECLVTLEGHTDWVNGVTSLADGRLCSWSKDGTLRFWHRQSRAGQAMAAGHSQLVVGLMALADRRLLSWSLDGTLRLWDGQGGECLAILKGHAQGVAGALALADGRLLSWSADGTLRLWDGRCGAALAILAGHEYGVNGALPLKDGRLLSWSADKTLRLWDGQSGVPLETLADGIDGALPLANGDLLTWRWDNVLRWWDGRNGACLATMRRDDFLLGWGGPSGAGQAPSAGEADRLRGALVLRDGRLLTWSGLSDTGGSLQLWDCRDGVRGTALEGHASGIVGALELVDGRLLSWSYDHTLRLWDGRSGACLAVLTGHAGSVRGARALAGGRFLSWAMDGTLRLWDGESGACLAALDELEAARLRPEWLYERAETQDPANAADGFFLDSWAATARMHHRSTSTLIAAWNADCGVNAETIFPDGSAAAVQADNQICILKLHRGGSRVTLAEARRLLETEAATDEGEPRT